MQTKRLLHDATVGDSAVDGLIAGLLAGLAMIVALVLMGLAFGDAPGAVLSRFDANSGTSSTIGLLLHLAVAGVYGVIYGVGWHLSRRLWSHHLPAWPFGLAYGLALFFLAEMVLLPGSGSPLLEIMPGHFSLAHVVYGLTLALAIERHPVH